MVDFTLLTKKLDGLTMDDFQNSLYSFTRTVQARAGWELIRIIEEGKPLPSLPKTCTGGIPVSAEQFRDLFYIPPVVIQWDGDARRKHYGCGLNVFDPDELNSFKENDNVLGSRIVYGRTPDEKLKALQEDPNFRKEAKEYTHILLRASGLKAQVTYRSGCESLGWPLDKRIMQLNGLVVGLARMYSLEMRS
ncbi:MAG: hypothetical protein Q7R56_02950 [Nanoarchaeota archaeon]|nr:hypothetical protein [Nanoarchaeota archaeon]